MPRVKVEGTEQLSQIARVLEAQGNSKALKRRMTKAFKTRAEPIARDQRADMAKELPHRGGAAATISGGMKATVRVSYVKATVDILEKWPGHDIKAIERGVLRHPTFQRKISLFGPSAVHGGTTIGRRMGEWHVTKVPPRIMGRAFDAHKPEVVAALAAEMTRLAEEIARET